MKNRYDQGECYDLFTDVIKRRRISSGEERS